jgi:hypothetical protein
LTTISNLNYAEYVMNFKDLLRRGSSPKGDVDQEANRYAATRTRMMEAARRRGLAERVRTAR